MKKRKYKMEIFPEAKVQCLHCGRYFIKKLAHQCTGGYRKHHHKWLDVNIKKMKNEEIKITEQEILDILKDKWKVDVAKMLNEIIIYARMMNFQVGERYKPGIMHGTEYIHGLLERKVITNDLYQKLKRVVEDPEIEYEITI